MDTKFVYLSLLVVALVVGYLGGRAIARRSVGRLAGIMLTLIGGIGFLIGQVGADFDHRFRLIAIGGLGLQVAGLVSAFGMKRSLKSRSVDLWAPQK